MRTFSALMRDRRGTAAAEMALVTPMLLILMFGGAEMGYFMWQQHVVSKGVRDGARFAGRKPFADFSCSAVSNSATAQEIQNVTATGQVGSGAITRLPGFTASTVTITMNCSGTTTGIYATQASGAPTIRVRASVPYNALFSTWFLPTGMSINASAQAAVMGA